MQKISFEGPSRPIAIQTFFYRRYSNMARLHIRWGSETSRRGFMRTTIPRRRIFIYLKLVFALSTSRSCNPSFYGRRVQQSRVLFIYLFISVEKFRFFSTFCKNALFENFLIVPRVCGCAFRVRANDFESVFFSLYIRQHNAK